MARSHRRSPSLPGPFPRSGPLSMGQLSRMGPGALALLFLILLAVWGAARWRGRGDWAQGVVAHVVDGDTLVVAVDGWTRRVRLLGVDTPETVHPDKGVEPYGPEASAFTKRELTGRRVWLEYDAAPLDKYQRHLAYVWTQAPARGEEAIRQGMFNARLLSEGWARVLTIQPNSRHADLFVRIEREARSAGRGQWAAR